MKIIRYLRLALRNYDNFGVSFDFNIQGNKQYKSICGGILSVLMTTILLVIFINGVISILQREKFQIFVQQKQNMNPEYSEMNMSNFMFAVKVDDPFKTYYPEENKTAFSILVNQVKTTTDEKGSRNKTVISQIHFENCSEKHFENIDYQGQEQIKNDLSGYLCLPLNYSLRLQGTFNSEVFYYPTLKISICKTEDCYTNEQLADFAANQSFMITVSTIIQSSNFIRDSQANQIIQTLNSDFFLKTNLLQESKADLFFQKNKVQVNQNLFSFVSSSYEYKNYWSFSIFNYREYKEYHSSPETIFTVNFRISQDYEETRKQVDTIDDFLSYFGGLLKVISSLFGIIALKYNELGLRISVANHLYQFNIPKKVNGKYQYSYDNFLNFIQTQINRVSDLQAKLKGHTKTILVTTKYMKAWVSQKFQIQTQTPETQQQFQPQDTLQFQPTDTLKNNQQIEQYQFQKYIEQLQEYKISFLQDLISKINETGRELRLGLNFIFYELICCSCCEKVKQTRKMLKKCERIINQDLDIIHLLKKVQEIDKLKQILLVEDQLKVFDYTPKPIINLLPKFHQKLVHHNSCLLEKIKLEQRKQASSRRRQGFTAPKNLIDIYESYSKLKEDHSSLNQRIIQLLGPTMELLFQNYYSIQKMAQRLTIQECNQGQEQEEQIQILTLQDDKQSPRIVSMRNEISSHQSIQIPAKFLNTDNDEIKED